MNGISRLKIFGSLLGIAGSVILWVKLGPLAMFGVFIMIWGNNIERMGLSRRKWDYSSEKKR